MQGFSLSSMTDVRSKIAFQNCPCVYLGISLSDPEPAYDSGIVGVFVACLLLTGEIAFNWGDPCRM